MTKFDNFVFNLKLELKVIKFNIKMLYYNYRLKRIIYKSAKILGAMPSIKK